MAKHSILISVGSNIDREYYTRASLKALAKHFSSIRCSSVYESESVGFAGSPFYNLVVSANTALSVGEVCQILKEIEREHGRKHHEKKFCSRTLDLDLLTYDDKVISTPVILPREEILYNAFVLWPLAELVPQRKHPSTGRSYQSLWDDFDKQKQHLWPINFSWS
jgi:2-amino-4-hydroxy-6-hydroxymethyldihydropteridine diphosphokinase